MVRVDNTMGQEETYSLTEAAQRFQVSDKTLRRWIKAGRIPATQIPGPYGPAWRIPAQAVHTAQQVIDVVPVARTMDSRTLGMVIAQAVSQAVAQETQALITEITQLRQQVETLTTALNHQEQDQTQQSASRDQWVVTEIRRVLKEQAMANKPVKQSWWQRLISSQ